jgi:Protein of unknown function (DUF2934)
MDTHHRIRERAYALWVEEGCVHGRADDYWLRAERELYALQPEANENAAKPKKTRTRRGPTVKEAA